MAALGGYSVGLATRFTLRTTVRQPSIASFVSGLRRASIDVTELERPEAGARELCGHLGDGRSIVLKAAGREVHGAGLVHLAHFEPDTLVLARERLEGPGFDGNATQAHAAGLFAALRRLHEIGVAHRDLRTDNLLCEAVEDPDDIRVGFRTLDRAVVGAGELVRRLDLAQILTSIGSVVGAERAVAAMRAGYEPHDEQAVAAILQPIALSSWGWSEMRDAREYMREVRRGESTTEIPDVQLERFRWRTVAAVVAAVVAAWLLVGQLSKVDLLGALRQADWTWFLVAIVASAVTYFGSSINLVAFVPQKVSVLKGTVVELSGAFFGLVTPASVGHVAVNGRFLHKQGVSGAVAGTAIALSQLVNFIVTVVLLVVAVLLTGTGVGSLKIVPGPRLLGVLGGLVVIGVLLITVVGWTKRPFWDRVWPRIRGAWPQLLEVLSQPMRLVEGIGGNLILTASYALALIASLHAVGAHPPIIATAAVFMAGNTVGAAAPTPGGLGAVEAVMFAGLTAIGIPAHEAVPGVLLFRIATFWLPIVPGWVMWLVLQRRQIL